MKSAQRFALCALLLLIPLSAGWKPASDGWPEAIGGLGTWVHTSQADWMAGERDHLDVRTLDALGTPYGFDQDPRGAMRLRSQPGLWSKHPESPVVVTGEEGSWDDGTISEAKVVYDGERFHMWYAGRRRGPPGLKMPMDLGYATSDDGVHWQKPLDEPVLVRGPVGGYDENMITAPAVLYDGEQFHMWFSAVDFAADWSINYATSADGQRWDKHAENPLLQETHDDRWDADYVAEPTVLYNGTSFEMWYNGASSADRSRETLLGYASSDDGVHWERFGDPRPALDVGPDGEWDDYAVARAHVMYDGEMYKMWYEGHGGDTWRIGYATSPDGIQWDRYDGNPIVALGAEGAWDHKVASEPFALFDGETYWLYHSGYDGDRYRVGLVTAPAVYATEGTYLSVPISSPVAIAWGTLTADLALPGGTEVQFEVSTSDDGEAWSAWRVAPLELANGMHQADLSTLDLPRSRQLRYRATLMTDDTAVSPVVYEVAVAEAVPDLSLEVSPSTVSLEGDQRAEIVVSLIPLRGFDAPVYLSVRGLPDGLSAAWSPRVLVPPATARIELAKTDPFPPDQARITVIAESGDVERSAEVVVLAAVPTPTATPQPAPTPQPTPTALPERGPLAPVDPQRLWLGIGLTVGSLVVLAVWLLLLLLIRPRSRGGSRRPWWRHWAWMLLLLALAAGGLYLSWQYVEVRKADLQAYQSVVRPGVQVAGIDAGRLTPIEAREAVEARAVAPYLREIAVRYAGRTAILDTAALNLQTNLDKIVAQAQAAGQEGELDVRAYLTQNPPPLDVSLALTYTFEEALIAPWVEGLAAEVDREPVPHTWDPETLTLTRGKPGLYLETEAAVLRLGEAIHDLSVHEVALPVTQTEPDDWSDDEISAYVTQAAARWGEPPLPAVTQQITLAFDAERWISPQSPAKDWQPTRPMTGYTFLPGRMGWELDEPATATLLREALDADVPLASTYAFTEVAPPPLSLADIKPSLLEIAAHFYGLTGLYVQDLSTGEEIRHSTYVTTSGMSMIKVAIMATAYRTIAQPFSADLEDALAQMIAHSINEKSNAVILEIGEGDFALGLERVNETLRALGMHQSYISSGYRVPGETGHARIPVPERPPVEIPPDEQLDLWPDPAMQTSLSDQAILFEALYHCSQGDGRLLAAFPNLAAGDCQEMLDLLKTNPTRTLLGPGFSDDVPMAHKNGFGGGQYTDERMDVGIIWPPGGRPYLVGLYQWVKEPWIHWLRVWPQQIELSTTLYNYFTMPATRPAPDMPR